MRKAISGVLTAIVTPFTAEGALNLPALRQQVQRQLAAGNGIFCGGTNGEFFASMRKRRSPSPELRGRGGRSRAGGGPYWGGFHPGDAPAGQQIARLGVTRYRPLPRGSCP